MTNVTTMPRVELDSSVTLRKPPVFRSFWIAGFECSCQINSHGKRVDMTAALRHDELASQDNAMLRSLGILTARDGVRWHLVDRGGNLDFSSFAPMVKAARDTGIQIIWDVCHYGWPDDIDVFSAEFLHRFARFAGAVAHFVKEESGDIPMFAQVNEINFFAWAATPALIYPYAFGRDGEMKRQLVRAAIVAAEAILTV